MSKAGIPFAIVGILLLIFGFIRYSYAHTEVLTRIPVDPDSPLSVPTRHPHPQEKSAGISMMVLGVALIVIGAVIILTEKSERETPKAKFRICWA